MSADITTRDPVVPAEGSEKSNPAGSGEMPATRAGAPLASDAIARHLEALNAKMDRLIAAFEERKVPGATPETDAPADPIFPDCNVG